MPRKPRRDVVLDGCPHHVIVRGNNRRTLFSYPSCYRLFLRLVARASSKVGVQVHAIMLMRNHVHIVVTPHDAEQLARWVKLFAQSYASRRNRARASSGKLFEQRYVAIPIRSEAQLAATIAYVELNPVRARLVDAPEQWQWSTYSLHAGGSSAPEVSELWIPHPWWTALGRDTSSRHRVYRELAQTRDAAARVRDEAPVPYARAPERPDRSSAADASFNGVEYGALQRIPQPPASS